MCYVHAVFVCPQLGTGVFAVSKSVNSSVFNSQGIGGIVIVTDFNSRFSGSTVVAVIEGAVVYNEVGGFGFGCLTVKQNCLAVCIECAAFKCHIRAAPSPYGILVSHAVFKGAIYECSFSVQGQLALDCAVFIGQFIADNTIKAAFTGLNGEVFKCEGRTALIVQLSALCADSICDNIYSLAAVTAESDVAALGALMCNAIVKGEAACWQASQR